MMDIRQLLHDFSMENNLFITDWHKNRPWPLSEKKCHYILVCVQL